MKPPFRPVLFLCALILSTLHPVIDVRAGSIYTWTDQSGMVHLTQSPPPSGYPVENVMNNPPCSPPPRPQTGRVPNRSVWTWEIRRAEEEVRQAQQQTIAAEVIAQQAEMQAQETLQRSERYIDTHDNNQYQRRVFKFQLKQAKRDAEKALVEAQDAVDQLAVAERQYQAALDQLKNAREDAALSNRPNGC